MTEQELLSQKNELIKEKEIFTTKEAARFLRTSSITLWRERKAGNIAFHRVASKIVYTRQDLESYLERNKREAFGITKQKDKK